MALYTLMLCLLPQSYLGWLLSLKTKFALYGIVCINTLIIPAFTIYYLKRKGVIESYNMHKRKGRLIPYAMTFIYYSLTYLVLRNTALPDLVFAILLSGVCGVGLVLVINLFWKISAHATGAGSLVGVVSALYIHFGQLPWWLVVCMWLVLGFICSARLWLNAHKPSQVYSGAVLGILSSFLLVYYIIKI